MTPEQKQQWFQVERIKYLSHRCFQANIELRQLSHILDSTKLLETVERVEVSRSLIRSANALSDLHNRLDALNAINKSQIA